MGSPNNIIHLPRLVTGQRGEQCANPNCQRNLQGHVARLQPDGTLLCVVCYGLSESIPSEVIETLKQMEREHGKR